MICIVYGLVSKIPQKILYTCRLHVYSYFNCHMYYFIQLITLCMFFSLVLYDAYFYFHVYLIRNISYFYFY